MSLLYDLITQKRVIGGGIIWGSDDEVQYAMPIVEVDEIADNWVVFIGPWQAVRNNDDSQWRFWRDASSHSIFSDLIVFAKQVVDDKFRISIVEVTNELITWRPRSKRQPTINKMFSTVYFGSHFPVRADEVIGMPADLANLDSWNFPSLQLTPEEWKGLIGYNDAQSRKLFVDLSLEPNDDLMWALPRCCSAVEELRDILSSVFDRSGKFCPANLETLRSSIKTVLESHPNELAQAQKLFDKISAQLDQMPTYT